MAPPIGRNSPGRPRRAKSVYLPIGQIGLRCSWFACFQCIQSDGDGWQMESKSLHICLPVEQERPFARAFWFSFKFMSRFWRSWVFGAAAAAAASTTSNGRPTYSWLLANYKQQWPASSSNRHRKPESVIIIVLAWGSSRLERSHWNGQASKVARACKH